jgi:hypothetical protein
MCLLHLKKFLKELFPFNNLFCISLGINGLKMVAEKRHRNCCVAGKKYHETTLQKQR